MDSVKNETERDFILWGAISLLFALGIVMLFSASLSYAEHNTALTKNNPYYFSLKQNIHIWLALFLMWVTSLVPISWWEKTRPILFISIVVLLILVLVIGTEINGSKRWLKSPFITIQPSEWAKLVMIIFIAGYVQKFKHTMNNEWGNILKITLIPAGIICLLLMFQTDFGSSVQILFLTSVMTFVGGAHLFGFLILFVIVIVFLLYSLLFVDYIKLRLLNSISPWDDPFNTGYNLTQSLMAIGRGDLTGVGLGNGIHKLNYLPEGYTDFIFSIMTEEIGLIGGFFILLLYGVVFWRLYVMSSKLFAENHVFSGMILLGISLWLFSQVFLNIAGAIQLLPPKGLVLPFFSYGGNFMVVLGISLGLIARIEHEHFIKRRNNNTFNSQ